MRNQPLPVTTKTPQSIHMRYWQVLDMAWQIGSGFRISQAFDHFFAVWEWHNRFANLGKELFDASSDAHWMVVFLKIRNFINYTKSTNFGKVLLCWKSFMIASTSWTSLKNEIKNIYPIIKLTHRLGKCPQMEAHDDCPNGKCNRWSMVEPLVADRHNSPLNIILVLIF